MLKTKRSNVVEKETYIKIEIKKDNINRFQVSIYPDGSANAMTREGGYGAVLVGLDGKTREIKGRISDVTSNQMEFMAILMAIHSLKVPCEIIICTDSQLALNVLSGKWKALDSRLLQISQEIKNEVKKGNHKIIGFEKIKGHSGHTYNERADELADYSN